MFFDNSHKSRQNKIRTRKYLPIIIYSVHKYVFCQYCNYRFFRERCNYKSLKNNTKQILTYRKSHNTKIKSLLCFNQQNMWNILICSWNLKILSIGNENIINFPSESRNSLHYPHTTNNHKYDTSCCTSCRYLLTPVR